MSCDLFINEKKIEEEDIFIDNYGDTNSNAKQKRELGSEASICAINHLRENNQLP